MQYKLFTALPDFLTKLAKELLLDTNLSEETGRLSWPRVIKYAYENEWGEKIMSPLPPKNETKYHIHVYNIEAWEYLCKTGWAYDERHTGRKFLIVDNRKAPGA